MTSDRFGDAALFSGKTFTGLDIASAEPRNRRFEDCRFVDCRLTGSAMRVSSFLQCSFEGCDLSNWDVEGLRFVDVLFRSSKLVGVDWQRLKADPLTAVRFEDCVLDYSTFARFRLKGSKLKGCSLRDINFERADLSGADCRDSDFSGSVFSDTDLRRADLRGARGYVIDGRTNRVKGLRVSLPDALGLLAALEVRVE